MTSWQVESGKTENGPFHQSTAPHARRSTRNTKMRVFFSKFRAPSFLHCVFHHLRHGSQKKCGKGPVFKVFGTSGPFFRLRSPEIFGSGMCHKISGFHHVLSVSVVPSVSVESVKRRFLRCVFGRYDAVCHVCATRRNRLCRPRKLLACGPKHCRFSRTSHGSLSTSYDKRGSKVLPILRGWHWIPNKLCLELVPVKSPRETDLGNTVVETRLCRAALSCSAHSAAWRNAPLRIAPCCCENA